jgi:uncharacterized protein YndB with AHSA1/START domain
MPRASATRELLASRDDVWAFIAEPHHFSDWWPGIAGVRPDRRGLAEGARWEVHGFDQPTLLRRSTSSGMLLVRAVNRPERFAWTMTGDHVDADLRLEEGGPERTLATLVVEAPWLYGLSRTLPRRALGRLHALYQTAAEL